MNNLVEKLRKHESCLGPKCENREIINEAADTIEQLTKERDELVKAMEALHASKLPYKDESGIIEVTLGAWGQFLRAIPAKHKGEQ